MATSQAEPIKTSPKLAEAPKQSVGDARKLAALLQFEADIRRQSTVNELQYLIANETRNLLPYGQMFVLRQKTIGDGMKVTCASSLATIDRNASLIHALEVLLAKIDADHGLSKPRNFDLGTFGGDEALADYPYTQMQWQPMLDEHGGAFGGLLTAREEPFREGEEKRLARVAETGSHAWRALSGGKPVRSLPVLDSTKKKWIAAAIAVILVFPVRLTALAPAEIVAERPFIIAAPFSGRIDAIEVIPNAPVKKGDILLRFDDVRLANELDLAEERLLVARSRLERSTSSAFGDQDETSDIAIMRAELEVAQVEYDYAKDLVGQSAIVAPRDGMALFSDRRDWEGRAVNAGDPIMQVVDPDATMIRIDLPSAEQMTLERGAKVKMWLDSQPLWAVDATLDTASYQSRQTADGTLAFALTARLNGENPRIGSRGTAKVYGQWVPLFYSVLRRPIAALRQFIGI